MGGRRGRGRDVVELHLEVHPEVVDLLGEFADDRDDVGVTVDPDHQPQGQVPVDDDLFDIDEVGVVGGEDGHDPRGDSGPVGPRDGEEGRGAGGAHVCS